MAEKTDALVNHVGLYLDGKGLTITNTIDPVDGSTVVGLDLQQLSKLVDMLKEKERIIAKVNAYADDRGRQREGRVCGSRRVASDLYQITGAPTIWERGE
ncbi:hypothetical protein SEA_NECROPHOXINUS_12 [Microbacterium phage Necrophoxinus]|nr:hypothetical protein SEA_LYELL_12 [Microbacterium phage Lyell]QWS69378.1 hypothetical protein SEA_NECROPHOXINUS_12 [Microbacterium phage Necrophoxinus]URM87417.1 hypothetical protein SEA_DUSTYDINO_12 [Microbacterium phage DustyDino]WMI33884.1 hypothetical protein SEA_ERENYEAGER_9 [Microbacterium phage Erenyeager]